MNVHYQRARLLASQDRHAEALAELQAAVTAEPDNPFHEGLRAMCLSDLDRHQQALESARRCIEIAPDFDYSHFVLARVLADRERWAEAKAAIQTALRLDPEDAQYHGFLAQIEFALNNWDASLTAASQGLQLDASDDTCRHWRALALQRLGRKDEASRDFDTLLAETPEDPYTHNARGWFLLEQGRTAEAQTHFLEALRLMPGLAAAREGFASVLKSRHLLFGWTLRLLLWLGRFRMWTIYGAAIAVFMTLRFGDQWVARHPEQYLWVALAKFAVWTVVVVMAIAQPLFNIVLRFDREGRRVLTDEQKQASNWNALALLAGLLIMALWAWGGGRMLPTLALCAVMLTSGIDATYAASCDWVRRRMKWLTLLAAVIIPLSWLLPIVIVILALKFKIVIPLLIRVMFFLPLVSLLISGFSEHVLEYLEKRKPDAPPRPN